MALLNDSWIWQCQSSKFREASKCHRNRKVSLRQHKDIIKLVDMGRGEEMVRRTKWITRKLIFSSVQSFSCVRLFVTPWITAYHASLSITNSRSLPKLMCTETVMPFSHLILRCPLLLLPPIPPSIRDSQWVTSSHEVTKVLKFQLQHQSFQRTPRTDLLEDGLIGSPCCLRDSQESSPTTQFKSIN